MAMKRESVNPQRSESRTCEHSTVAALSVRRSAIHGRGVFTDAQLGRGEFVAFVQGRTRTVDGRLLYTPEEAAMNPNWIGVSTTTWIVPDRPYVYINHSCDPSCGILGVGHLHALRDLAPGDEITIDYSISEANPYWHMECSCGSERCQKRLRSIAYLPPETYERYYPFIPDALATFYQRYRKTGTLADGASPEQDVASWLRSHPSMIDRATADPAADP
jgi:hypothetical protein